MDETSEIIDKKELWKINVSHGLQVETSLAIVICTINLGLGSWAMSLMWSPGTSSTMSLFLLIAFLLSALALFLLGLAYKKGMDSLGYELSYCISKDSGNEQAARGAASKKYEEMLSFKKKAITATFANFLFATGLTIAHLMGSGIDLSVKVNGFSIEMKTDEGRNER